jgi:hypothetical protein
MSVLICIDGDKAHSIHHLYSQPDSQAYNKNASHSSKSSFCDFIIALTLYRLSIRDRGCRNGSIEESVLEQAPEEFREQGKGRESLTVYSKYLCAASGLADVIEPRHQSLKLPETHIIISPQSDFRLAGIIYRP